MGLFGDLLNNVTNLINLTNVFGGDSSKTYPSEIGQKTQVQTVTNYITNYATRDWQSNRGYSFTVVRVTNQDGAERQMPEPKWSEFRLQINPQELDQDEIFAIEVTPTLRGILVEHHGVILKDISIQGTTGISPLRRAGGANAKSGAPILQSGHSGYQEFHELRSLFRAYVEAKRLDQRAKGELRMVFSNYKDQEYIYVEPQKFSMKRSASRPMLYDYAIQLKGIGYAVNPASPAPAKTLIGTLDDVLQAVTDNLQLATQVLQGGLQIIESTERAFASAILGPLNQINVAILAIKGGQAELLGPQGITQQFVASLKGAIENAESNLNDVFGRNTAQYNAFIGKTTTIVGTPNEQSTFAQLQILNAIGKAKQALILIGSQQQLFTQNVFDANAGVVSYYGNLVSLTEPNSVKRVQILGDDNIQTIALREMGSVDNFRDIVILNNLNPPYISPAGGSGVLMPGQFVLIPQTDGGGSTGAVDNKKYNITANMNATEQSLGVDIQLTPSGDLAVTNQGDLSLVAGLTNMAQAVVARLFLEVGGLKRHPSIGTDLNIGSKVTSQFLSQLQSRIISSFSQDSRIESIPYIALTQNGGTTTINMLIKLRNVEQPVPLPLTLQTG